MNIVAVMGIGMVGLAVIALLAGWWLGRTSGTGALRSLLAGKEAELASKNAEVLRLTSEVQEHKEETARLLKEKDGLTADQAKWKQSADGLAEQNIKQEEELRLLRGQVTALQTEITQSSEQLKAAQLSLASERELLATARVTLTDTFKSLAGDILKDNNAQFLGLANRELSAKEESIEKLLSPVRETLGKMEMQTQQLETKRAEAYAEVLTEIKNIQETHKALRMETTQLVQALRAPKARGNWGELQLKRCVEFAGMVQHCSFDTEVFMRGDQDASQRPDVVVQLPNGRAIIIDAKTPLDAYLSAMSTTDEIQRAIYLKAHAAQVRAHLTQLGSKKYGDRLQNSPDFVVCFLPSEVLFSAALEQDPSLIEFGSQANVILATPTTLIALLKAVAYGWQQMEITRNAIEICKTGEELYKKLAGTRGHFENLRGALNRSVLFFNSLLGAVDGQGDNVFSLARKLHELKIGQEEIVEVAPIESKPRALKSDHWAAPIALAASEETSEER